MIVSRLANYLQAFVGSPKPEMIFMHVPKTGGTSIDQALRRVYGRQDSYKVDSILTSRAVKVVNQASRDSITLDKFQIRESLLLCEMVKGTRYISGHFHFNSAVWNAYAHQYSWITVLRNPVKRYVSQYFFDAFKPEDHARVNESLEEFVDSPRGQVRGQNYINYFGNFDRHGNIDPDEKLEFAKANLSKFAVVGFLEHLEDFTNRLMDKFQLNVHIPHMNKNPVAKPAVSDDVIHRIEEICKYDRLLYDYAKAQFSQTSPDC